MPSKNAIAPDEIEGHTGMFDAKTNDGYYQLGLAAANIIRDAICAHNGTVPAQNPAKVDKGSRSRSKGTKSPPPLQG